jgi:hypothetical protein
MTFGDCSWIALLVEQRLVAKRCQQATSYQLHCVKVSPCRIFPLVAAGQGRLPGWYQQGTTVWPTSPLPFFALCGVFVQSAYTNLSLLMPQCSDFPLPHHARDVMLGRSRTCVELLDDEASKCVRSNRPGQKPTTVSAPSATRSLSCSPQHGPQTGLHLATSDLD